MEVEGYLRFVLALVFVLALIGVLAAFAKRFNLGFPTPMKTGRNRRLAVVEVAPLDSRRRLVLVRRDQVEHLVLLGPGQDVVIESGIPAARGGIADGGKGTPPGATTDVTGGAAP